MELLLIRHSITAGNLARKYVGRTDEALCAEGVALAKEAAGRFPGVQRVYSSPMRRCRETAALLFPGLEPVMIGGLRETDFGKFEGKSYDELKDDPDYVRWLDSGGEGPVPGGESKAEASERTMLAFGDVLIDLMNGDWVERAAIVAHGGTIMTVMSALGLPEREYYGWQVKNCGGFLVKLEGERLRVVESY